jgi:hypothetical protein
MRSRASMYLVTALAALSVGLPSQAAFGERQRDRAGLMVAQTSMGGSEPAPATVTPAPVAPPQQPEITPPKSGGLVPGPSANPQPPTSSDVYWGAIAFTADGSYSSVWKMGTKAEAEAKVATQCASFGRGSCEVASFSGRECVALATFIGSHRRRRWILSFTAGGFTYPEAQNAAVTRCNTDERSQGRCQPRTVACADGR